MAFTRARARGLVDLANTEHPGQDPIVWTDPTDVQHGRKVRVVLEKIQITDDREPFFKKQGEFRFVARAWTPDNGGILKDTVLPARGHFSLGGRKGRREVTPNAVLFEDWAEHTLALEIAGVELDTFDRDDRLNPFKELFRGDPASWFGSYAPSGGAVDPLDLDGWRLWFRIEPA